MEGGGEGGIEEGGIEEERTERNQRGGQKAADEGRKDDTRQEDQEVWLLEREAQRNLGMPDAGDGGREKEQRTKRSDGRE